MQTYKNLKPVQNILNKPFNILLDFVGFSLFSFFPFKKNKLKKKQ